MLLIILIFCIVLIFFFMIYKKSNIETFRASDFKNTINNKTILITSSTKGIGFELAKLLSKYNCNIVICGIDKVEAAEKQLKQFNNNIISIKCDLSDSKQVESLFKKATDTFNTIDYCIQIPLINTGSKFIRDKKLEDWSHDLNANVNAIYQLSQLCVKHMNYYNTNGKIITVIAELDKKKTNNSQILLQDMITNFNKMISEEVYNSKIAVVTVKIDIPQSSNLYSNLPKNFPKLNNILDIFKSLDSLNEVSVTKILQVFLYVIEAPSKNINGKIISSNIFLNDKSNPDLALLIDEKQLVLNNNVYGSIKYQPNIENAYVLSKQNPYSPPSDVIDLFKNGGLPYNEKTTHYKYESKIIELIASNNNISKDNICLFKNQYEALTKVAQIFIGRDNTIITEYPTWNLLELVCKENNIKMNYLYLKDNGNINIQPKLQDANSISTNNLKIIYLSCPNIVSGQELIKGDFDTLIQTIPDNVIILLDQTFIDYVKYPIFNALNYLDKNIIILRTFSNFYSIENLELSYIISNESFIKFVRDTQVINPINSFIDTLAVKCITNTDYKDSIIKKIDIEKNRMTEFFDKYNIKYFPSETNYMLVEISITKEELTKELQKIDIILYESNDGYASYITLPLGTQEINNRLIDILIMYS